MSDPNLAGIIVYAPVINGELFCHNDVFMLMGYFWFLKKHKIKHKLHRFWTSQELHSNAPNPHLKKEEQMFRLQFSFKPFETKWIFVLQQ